jgi:hypothetical protein
MILMPLATLFTLLSAAPKALPVISPPTTVKENAPNEVLHPLPPPLLKTPPSSSYMSIPMKERALDLQAAFDALKREKTAGKVYFQLSDNTSISNVIDMTLLPNNSLILFRYNTNTQGIKLQVVKIEDIVGLSYN